MTFRTRTFIGVFVASAAALAVSTLLVERSLRVFLLGDIRQTLLAEARVTAHLLSEVADTARVDDEADRLGALLGARVTLIDADGRVLGDSEVSAAGLAAVDNHGTRPEILEAGRTGTGTDTRRSRTTDVDTMYAAVRSTAGPFTFVRVALPLTRVEERVSDLRRLALVGLLAGLLVAATTTAVASVLLNRRLRAVADAARHYAAGDFGHPARDYGADEIGMVATVLDATARQLGERLAESARARAETSAILTAMVEGVLLVDATGLARVINPALGRLVGNASAAEGQHYLDIVRQPGIASMLGSVLAGRPASPVEVEIDREPRRRVVANLVPVPDADGGGAVLVLHDITALRQADQVRRDFVANVSHELRTPLTAIRGYVEALVDGQPTPEQAAHLAIIARHAGRMERLVQDLLRLARLDAGQESVKRVRTPLADIVTAAARDLDPLVDRRRLRIDVGGDLTAVALSDPDKLHDVFRNLLENASHYSPEGGTVEVTLTPLDGHVAVAIADRGPGVPEADLARIFERFYRVDRSRSRDPGGTGLGLSIVRHLVELLSGSVTAARRSGGGAVFTVVLPVPGAGTTP